MPEVPTMDEAGYPDVHVQLWSGVFAPAKTPPAIVAKLEAELRRIMQLPEYAGKIQGHGNRNSRSSAAEFAKVIDAETKMWADVAKAANL